MVCSEPNFEQRKNLLTVFCKEKNLDPQLFDIELFAHMTEKSSSRVIARFFNTAFRFACRRGQAMTNEHLYEALNVVVRNLVPASALSATEKHCHAVYLSGIALAEKIIQPHFHLEAITIKAKKPDIIEQYDWQVKDKKQDIKEIVTLSYGHYFVWHDNEQQSVKTLKDKKDECKLLLASNIAQELVLNEQTEMGLKARQKALEKAQEIVLKGLKLENLSKKQQEKLKDDALALVETYETELRQELSKHIHSIRKIAQALEEKELLRAPEITALCN